MTLNIVQNNWLRFGTIFVVNCLIYAAIAWLLPMRFEENDDIFFCLIANGGYSGVPDCHLVHQNALWGCLLAGLYSLTRVVEWYALLISILHILSMSIIIFKVMTIDNKTIVMRLLYAFLLYVLWGVVVLCLQYTTTAAIVCVAGCLLMLEEKKIFQVAGGIFIVVASFIRFEAAALVGIIFIPYILSTCQLQIRRYVKYLLLLIAIMAGKYSNGLFYKSPEWAYYLEYNTIRSQRVNDNPNCESIDPQVLERNHIDSVDYKALCSFFADPQVITLPVLKDIASGIQSVPIDKKVHNLNQLVRYRIPIVLLILLFGVYLCINEKRIRIMLLLTFLIMVLCLLLLPLEHSLKERVFYCILLALVTLFAILPFDNPNDAIRCMMVIVICAFSAKYARKISKEYEGSVARVQTYKGQRLLLSQLPASSTVAFYGHLCVEAVHPFKVAKEITFRAYPSGWLTYFPARKDVGNSHLDLLHPDVYIFTSLQKSELKSLRGQIKKHYDVDVNTKIVCCDDKYAIVKLIAD